MRFARAMPRISDSVIAALSAVDGNDHVAVAAFDGNRCVAIARFMRLKADPTAAELAVTVDADYRRLGLARDLILWLAYDAAEKGIEHFEVYIHPDNLPAVRLANRLVIWLERNEQEIYGRVGVARLIRALRGPAPAPRSPSTRFRPWSARRTADRRRRMRALPRSQASFTEGLELSCIIDTLR